MTNHEDRLSPASRALKEIRAAFEGLTPEQRAAWERKNVMPVSASHIARPREIEGVWLDVASEIERRSLWEDLRRVFQPGYSRGAS